MLLLHQHDVHVAGEAVQHVVRLHLVLDGVVVGHALLHDDVQLLHLRDQFVAVAGVALVLDDLALAAALVALLLLLDHTLSVVLRRDDHALALALVANLDLAVPRAGALALVADDFLVELQLLLAAVLDVLKTDLLLQL